MTVGSRRMLRIAAAAEAGSLAVLLLNLLTAHWEPVSSVTGPVHGCAYLFVVVLAFRGDRRAATRIASLVPGIGGLLVLRTVGPRARRPAEPTSCPIPPSEP
ncbi:DUF3817 domain-containing protein [Prauserella sp. PE36]|uniref:DUF3817 domain-containing protein n=1 Tax=Prauserella sp. PE36 TaxID=1504709 RepID=UPI001F39A74E|nr:DUF3817 domain-containing protein [Prauserella sp. PE36]